ncbi:flagellar assembly protein FliW [Pontibacillus halophilus JSM 076056 = DSM 19796]|uniref:Flagellar assembly factor FliW n=1 Tax=Pontibacillus halophilus JSM 076056 = DSM 19796 TaxID=1385510 RepID=A0A0A5IDN2_9BACI|nr:flagellar assembly protein FliW [Pontibacillus halophilus]KGX93952.1 flagellar assembly protein FliW [Pontibacillus halophilus JSM 076056 = DSM 19796]
MQVHTRFFDEITIEQDAVITFPNGLPGFLEEKEFVLLPIDENGIYQALQSIHSKEVCLVTLNPYTIYGDYEFDLDQATIDVLNIEKPEEVQVLSVATLREPFSQSTINLQAPIIVNVINRKAKQVILNSPIYQTKHPLQPKEGDDHART